MVKKEDETFVCKECGFSYKIKEFGQKCEDWCKKYHSGNLEITKYAL